MIQIIEKAAYRKHLKKLRANQKQALNQAVRLILDPPLIGEQKTTNLSGIRVYKFRMVNQLTLLAYIWRDDVLILTLLSFGSHENFYRDLKNQV